MHKIVLNAYIDPNDIHNPNADWRVIVGLKWPKKGLFVTWNGSSCDMAEFFKVVEITHEGVLSLPRWCPLLL